MTSANVVGYQNKTTRQNFNYVTPTFRPIAGLTGEYNNEMSIQEVQVDSTVGLGGSNFQKLNASGGMAVIYYWVNKANVKSKLGIDCPEGKNGLWAVRYRPEGAWTDSYRLPAGTDAEPNTLMVGEGIQVNAAVNKAISFNGEVGEETVAMLTRTARQNFNYFGNPFPQTMSIQNIQVDSTVGLGGSNFQKLNASGGMAVIYYWVNKANVKSKLGIDCPEGLNGLWAVRYRPEGAWTDSYRLPAGTEEEPDTLDAGEGCQLNLAANKQFFALCPYDL